MAEPIKIDLGDEIVSIVPRPGQSADEALNEVAQRDQKIAAFLGKTKQTSTATEIEEEMRRRSPTPLGPSPAQQMLRGGISAAATLPALVTPGGVLPKLAVEMIGPMLAETGMQQTGLAPKSGADIAAAGLVPLATRATLGLPGMLRGGTRGVANFVAPQTMRETGVETIKQMGLEKPSARLMFSQARQQGPVPKGPIIDAIQTAIEKEKGSLVSPSIPTISILKDFQERVWKSAKEGVSYDDLIDATQRLRQQAEGHFKRGNNVTGISLNKARAQILDAMDEVSPAIKQANALYRKEQAMQAITKEMRKTNPGNAVRNLLETDELVAGSFLPKEGRGEIMDAVRRGEWDKAPQLQQIVDMADRVGRAGTGITMGAFNRFLMAAFEPIAEGTQEPGSKAFLRMLMRNPRQPIINRTGASAAAQFGRGAFGRLEEENQ